MKITVSPESRRNNQHRIENFLYKEINVSKQKQSGDLYKVIRKEGTHLASSNDTEGASRGILFDDKYK